MVLDKFMGGGDGRKVKRLHALADIVNTFEPEMEELSDGEPELGSALGRAHRLVEELDMLPLLALFHVAAEGGNAGEDRDDEQDDREGADLEQLDDGEAERSRRQRSDGRG